MNIVVLGGNCLFTSKLSVELKKKLEHVIVQRIDLLQSFKDFTAVLSGASIRNKTSFSNAGYYIGDVEIITEAAYKKLLCTKEAKHSMLSIAKTLSAEVSKNDILGVNPFKHYAKKRIKDNNLFELGLSSSSSSRFFKEINIFSGAVLTDVLEEIPNSQPVVIIEIENNDTWLPFLETGEKLNEMLNKHFNKSGFSYFKVDSKESLLQNEDFINLLPSNKALSNLIANETKEEEEKQPNVIINADFITAGANLMGIFRGSQEGLAELDAAILRHADNMGTTMAA